MDLNTNAFGIVKGKSNHFQSKEEPNPSSESHQQRKRSSSNEPKKQDPLFTFGKYAKIISEKSAILSGLKWASDEERSILTLVFSNRGWEKVDYKLDSQWNIFWATSRSSIESLWKFHQFIDNQFINHFKNSQILTRKNLLISNWKIYLNSQLNQGTIHDFFPPTYILPEEIHLFKQNFESEKLWILKPADKARGIGISLIDSLDQIPITLKQKISSNSKTKIETENESKDQESFEVTWTESYVISKYILNPLLIKQKKFDLRVYVFVKSFQPLECYM